MILTISWIPNWSPSSRSGPAPTSRDSELAAAKPESVSNHRQRAERHRRARPDRTDQHAHERIECAGGDGHADGVIGKRQEQVLPDVPHRRATQAAGAAERAQVTGAPCDAGALDRDVR